MRAAGACPLLGLWCPVCAVAEVKKGAWWMPRLTEAMKDAISCDKPGLGANVL